MRTIAATLLAVVMVATACGGDDGPATGDGATASTEAALPGDLDYLGTLASRGGVTTSHVFESTGGQAVLGDGTRIIVPAGALPGRTEVGAVAVELALDGVVGGDLQGAVYRLSTVEDIALATPVVLEIAKPADSVLVAQRVDGLWSPVAVPAGPTTRVEIAHFSEVTTSVIDRPDSQVHSAPEPPADGIVPSVYLDSCVLMFVGEGDDQYLNQLALSVCTSALVRALTPFGESVEVACVGDRIGGDVDIRGAIAQCIADRTTADESAGSVDSAEADDPGSAPAQPTAPPAAPAAASPAGTVLDSIPDGTYFGTLSDFEFRDSITVISSGASLVKRGDSVEWEWSVQWEQALVECAYQNRDSWGGSEIRTATDTLLQIDGIRSFDVDLVSSCPGPSGDIASSFHRPMTLSLDGTQLSGNIGIAQVTFDLG